MVAKRIKFEGTLLKSKEDAAFAMSLTRVGRNWFYKPVFCGHRWTFFTFPCVGDGRRILIDYHPEMPSRLYADNLTDRTRQLPFESIIVWGSPWTTVKNGSKECCYNAYPVFTSHGKYGFGNFMPELDSGRSDLISLQHKIDEIIGIDESIAQGSKKSIDKYLSHA
jgi:hypothetical protein